MNNFNFLFPKSKKLDLDKIKKFSYQKHYLANDYSNLAYLLNNLVMSDLNEDILPFEKEITFKEYNAIIDIFKISLKHIHILQNNNTLEIDSLYKSFCKKNDMLNKIKQQKNELINRTSDLNEKMSEILTETEIFCEKIKNIEYKYMCPECLQVKIKKK